MSQQDSLFKESGTTQNPGVNSGDSSTPSSSTATQDDLAAQLKASQRAVSNLLVLLLVVSGTFSIYLLQTVRHDRADLNALKLQQQQLPQVRQTIAHYNQQTVPAISNFINQLTSYAQTHPDVMPIMLKYGLAQPRNPQSAAPSNK